MKNYLFRTLKAEEIDVRIGQAINSASGWQGVSLLLYKNARVDMDILDETVGAMNWQREQLVVKDNLYCNVGIKDEKTGEWVWKSDCGVESYSDKEKGEASDAFKRACVNWGIGRELYTARDIIAECKLDKEGKKPATRTTFYVAEIAYDENRKISFLKINAKTKTEDKTVFTLGNNNGSTHGEENKPAKPADKPPASNAANMTLEQALKFSLTRGKHANVPFENVPQDYLEWVSEKFDGQAKIAADLVLADMRKTVSGKRQIAGFDDDSDIPF